MRKNRGQNLLEYALVLGVVTVALVSMQPYFKRGIQSLIKVAADDYGPQGAPISDLEIRLKKKAISETLGEKAAMNSNSEGTWTKTLENKGESNIVTKISGSNTVTSDSFWIGSDYRTRKVTDTTSTPPPPPG